MSGGARSVPAAPQDAIDLKISRSGDALLPSATKRPDGAPRFVMPIDRQLIDSDAGVSYMVRHELFHAGFERLTRDLIDAHLRPGDLFIDIGAHWGLMSMSALTRLPGQVHALAFEPYPHNLHYLLKAIRANKLEKSIDLYSMAVASKLGLLPLTFNSTMGHSLLANYGRNPGQASLQVMSVPLDQALKLRPDLGKRRVIMKIDVEGVEPEVIEGARALLESGRVALIVWEKGANARLPERAEAYRRMETELTQLGFRHFMFAYPEWAGPLLPLLPDQTIANVYSFGPGMAPSPVYRQDFAKRPPLSAGHFITRTAASSAAVTEAAMRLKSTDGARWADVKGLLEGAEARAKMAGRLIGAAESVLDIGAGAMALERELPAGTPYAHADVVARRADTALIDLNQGQFPPGSFDVVALLAVLEHVHDPEAVLRSCRAAARRLVIGYDPVKLPVDDLQRLERRQRGYFNDLSVADLEALLARAGWKIGARETSGRLQFLAAVRA